MDPRLSRQVPYLNGLLVGRGPRGNVDDFIVWVGIRGFKAKSLALLSFSSSHNSHFPIYTCHR